MRLRRQSIAAAIHLYRFPRGTMQKWTKVKLECLRIILRLKLDAARSALLRDFITAYLTLADEENARYNQQLAALEPNEKRQLVELLDEWTSTGMRQQSIRTAIRLLEHRFGTLPTNTQEVLLKLPRETLEELAIAVLDFRDFQDAQSWLSSHR